MSFGWKEFWKKGRREGVPSDIRHPRVFPTLNSNQMGIKNELRPKGKFRSVQLPLPTLSQTQICK